MTASLPAPPTGGTASQTEEAESAFSIDGSISENEHQARIADNRAIPSSTQTAPLENETSASEKPKIDPIAINGKYFDGWPKPKLALVISGRQDGYLEPCGCAGLDQQKGGMSRRHSFIRGLEDRGWPVAAVDVGGLVRRFGRQAELKFAISAEALEKDAL